MAKQAQARPAAAIVIPISKRNIASSVWRVKIASDIPINRTPTIGVTMKITSFQSCPVARR